MRITIVLALTLILLRFRYMRYNVQRSCSMKFFPVRRWGGQGLCGTSYCLRVLALGICLLLIMALGYSQARADTLPESKKSISFSEFLGVNTPFLFFDQTVYTKQIKLLKELGLKWVRIDLHWYHLEPEEGRYNLEPLDALMRVIQQEQLIPVVYLVGSAQFASTYPAGDPNIDQWPPRSNEEFAAMIAALQGKRVYAASEEYADGSWTVAIADEQAIATSSDRDAIVAAGPGVVVPLIANSASRTHSCAAMASMQNCLSLSGEAQLGLQV